VRGCGFHALAKRFDIKGGMQLASSWYRTWDGTPLTLDKQDRSNKKRKLNDKEGNQYITKYVEKKNEKGEPITYYGVREHVILKRGHHIPIRTITRCGKQVGLSYKRTTRTLVKQGIHLHIYHCSLASPYVFDY
jgi:transposase